MPIKTTKPKLSGLQTTADLAEQAGFSQADVMAANQNQNPDTLVGGLATQRSRDAVSPAVTAEATTPQSPRPIIASGTQATTAQASGLQQTGIPESEARKIWAAHGGDATGWQKNPDGTWSPPGGGAVAPGMTGTFTPRTEEEIRQEELKRAQEMINATQGIFTDQLSQIERTGAAQLQRSSSIAVGAGLAGSPFKEAQTRGVEQATNRELQAARNERAAQVAAIRAAALGRSTQRFEAEQARFRAERDFAVSERDKALEAQKSRAEAQRSAGLETIKNIAKGGLSLSDIPEADYQQLLSDSGISDFEAHALYNVNNPAAGGELKVVGNNIVNYYFDPSTGQPVVKAFPLPQELASMAQDANIKTIVTEDGIFAYNAKEAHPEFRRVGGAPIKDTGFTGPEASKFAIQLRKEFNSLPQVKDFQSMTSAFNKMIAVLPRARDGESGPARDAMVIVFNKMLDPGSVVREGEFARTQEGQDLLTKAEEFLKQLKQPGAGVSPETIQEMANTANDIYKSSLETIKPELDFYRSEASSAGLDPNRIIRDIIPLSLDGASQLPTSSSNETPVDISASDLSELKAAFPGVSEQELRSLLIPQKDRSGDTTLKTPKVDMSKALGAGAKNNNPGNLTFAGQTGAVKNGRWAKFPTPEAGFKALENQITLDTNRGLTLSQFVNKYAPPSENNTSLYARQMARSVGASLDTPLRDINRRSLARAIALKESNTVVV